MESIKITIVRSFVVDYIVDYVSAKLGNLTPSLDPMEISISKYLRVSDLPFDILLDAYKNPGLYFGLCSEYPESIIDDIVDNFHEYIKLVMKDIDLDNSIILKNSTEKLNSRLVFSNLILKK